MKKVANKDKTVYGIVTDNGVFVKWKWREENIGKKAPRICAVEVLTEHELTPDFWNKFEEVTNAEWNDLWAKDMNNIKYKPKP